MKTPFPALCFTSIAPGAVSVWSCKVLQLFPLTEQALIELPPVRTGGPALTKMVSFAALASTRGKALEKSGIYLADLISSLPADDQKSASEKKAGASAGEPSSPNVPAQPRDQ